MNFPFYKRDSKKASDLRLPAPAIRGLDMWTGYEADQDLEAAVNVSLLLGQPLLLTGEPGTGKTQLAFHLSNQFGWGDPFVFEAKSNSIYRDLFYTYDALGRFHAKDIDGASRDARDYIEYNALGRAILRTLERAAIEHYLGKAHKHDGPKSSVVLIDEIDKAPRDLPNDILREIENLYFKVPEIDLQEIRASAEHRVVVVITSNSEKNLPPAFLRRCTFFHIKPPTKEKLLRVLTNRFGELGNGNRFYSDAIEIYSKLRSAGLEKVPATAELLAWVAYLRHRGISALGEGQKDVLRESLSVLVKSDEDQHKASSLV
jgi:MoxR-like ATPase